LKFMYRDSFTLQYPEIRFLVNAESVGLKIPVGKPDILSVTCPEFASGGMGYAEIEVKNIGDDTGTFYPEFVENYPFSQKYAGEKITLNVGETGTLYVYLTSQTATEISKSCKIRVYDYHNSNNYDEYAFTVDMTAPKYCTAGEYLKQGNILLVCNAQGTGYDEALKCTDGKYLVYENNEWSCKATEGNTTEYDECEPIQTPLGEIPDVVCIAKVWWSNYGIWVMFGLGFTFFIIVTIGFTAVKAYIKSMTGGLFG